MKIKKCIDVGTTQFLEGYMVTVKYRNKYDSYDSNIVTVTGRLDHIDDDDDYIIIDTSRNFFSDTERVYASKIVSIELYEPEAEQAWYSQIP